MSKITAYGYYNHDNPFDQKEHLTLTPISEIENKDHHDYSGNTYEFETKRDLEYSKVPYKMMGDEWVEDRMRIKGEGGVDIEIFTEKGMAYLMPKNPAYQEPDSKEMLGNVKSHRINKDNVSHGHADKKMKR